MILNLNCLMYSFRSNSGFKFWWSCVCGSCADNDLGLASNSSNGFISVFSDSSYEFGYHDTLNQIYNGSNSFSYNSKFINMLMKKDDIWFLTKNILHTKKYHWLIQIILSFYILIYYLYFKLYESLPIFNF